MKAYEVSTFLRQNAQKNIEIQNSRYEKNGSLIGEMPGMPGQRLISIQEWTNHQKSNISP